MWLSSTVDLLQLHLMKVTVLAENSFIFSLGSLCYPDIYRCESGKCCTLPFFLTSLFKVFLLYYVILNYKYFLIPFIHA